MHIVPHLAHDIQFLPPAQTFVKCTLEYLSDLILVAVAGSTVKHTVACFDGTIDCIAHLIGSEAVRSERTHTYAGHFPSIRQSDLRHICRIHCCHCKILLFTFYLSFLISI